MAFSEMPRAFTPGAGRLPISAEPSAGLAANQLRLWLSAFAYQLVDRLRRFALKGTELAQATVGTIRLKLFKLAARVELSVRRMRVGLSEWSPSRALFIHGWGGRRALPG